MGILIILYLCRPKVYYPSTCSCFLVFTQDWGKGIVLINGRNLGRYWPGAGPTKTLYLPGPWLKQGDNEVSRALTSSSLIQLPAFQLLPCIPLRLNVNIHKSKPRPSSPPIGTGRKLGLDLDLCMFIFRLRGIQQNAEMET